MSLFTHLFLISFFNLTFCREAGVHVKDIVAQLTEEQTTYLKSQNGGLQTFIKNHRNGYIVSFLFVGLLRILFYCFFISAEASNGSTSYKRV